MSSDVSEVAWLQLQTIQFSLNETSRVHDVTVTLIDDVITNNNTVHRIISQVSGRLYVTVVNNAFITVFYVSISMFYVFLCLNVFFYFKNIQRE